MCPTSEERFNLPPQPEQACPLIDEVIMGITDKLGDVGDIARNLDFGQEQRDLLDIARYDEFREQLNEIRKRIEDIREWGQRWKNLAKTLSLPDIDPA